MTIIFHSVMPRIIYVKRTKKPFQLHYHLLKVCIYYYSCRLTKLEEEWQLEIYFDIVSTFSSKFFLIDNIRLFHHYFITVLCLRVF